MTNSIGEGPLVETILLIFVVSLSAVFCCWFVLVMRRVIEQFRNPSYDELNSPLLPWQEGNKRKSNYPMKNLCLQVNRLFIC